MRFVIFCLAAALGAVPLFPAPNVIVILSDDQGTVDLNIAGAKDLFTPNVDRLAREGVRFTQFYVGSPVCSPSRAALLTGRFPHRAGVPGNVGLGKEGLPSEQVTIAEMLRDHGYDTALFGKWHLGEVNGGGPLDQGFNQFFGHKRGCIDNYSHFFYWSGPNDHDLWHNRTEVWEPGTHFSDIILREATGFLREHRDKPFFLYLPFNIPHYPLQGLQKWRDYYQSGKARGMAENRFHYAALLSTLDEYVGKILQAVDENGLRENTLVVFLSDHGHSTEERTMFGGGSAGPYRGAKFSVLEGGIRVPAIARLPGVIPADELRGQFAVSLDWLPTISELTGAELPPGYKLDGTSLLPILKSETAPTRHKSFHWQLGDQWAVREGDWKLVVNGNDTDRSPLEGDEKVLLSNLAEDVTERRNLAAQHPDMVKRLTQIHQQWLAEMQ